MLDRDRVGHAARAELDRRPVGQERGDPAAHREVDLLGWAGHRHRPGCRGGRSTVAAASASIGGPPRSGPSGSTSTTTARAAAHRGRADAHRRAEGQLAAAPDRGHDRDVRAGVVQEPRDGRQPHRQVAQAALGDRPAQGVARPSSCGRAPTRARPARRARTRAAPPVRCPAAPTRPATSAGAIRARRPRRRRRPPPPDGTPRCATAPPPRPPEYPIAFR